MTLYGKKSLANRLYPGLILPIRFGRGRLRSSCAPEAAPRCAATDVPGGRDILSDAAVAHEARRVPEAGKHIVTRQRRVFLQDIVDGIPSAEKLKDRLGGDPGAANDRAAIADGGVDGNAVFHGFGS